MYFTDTHTHLYSEQFDNDRHEIVQKAIKSGVKKIILPGIDSSYIQAQTELVNSFPENCFQGIGLHPTHLKDNLKKELEIVKQNLKNKNVVAIGEIGIDLYWDKSNLENQKIAFEHQVLLAKKHKLPIIIHVRDAFDETFEIIEKLNDNQLTGVFHSFVGTPEQARKIISFRGFKIGINGIVTFKNSGLDKTVSQIPIEYILLETDAPWLAPTPFRGKRNESSYLINIARKLSEIYDISLEKLSEITNKNASDLFPDLN